MEAYAIIDILSMEPGTSIEALMEGYQHGDLAAARALVERVSPQLHRYFLAQVFSRRHADDLLQETWMRLHEARRSYRTGQPFLPWAYAIARNVRVDHYRRNRKFEGREPLTQAEALTPATTPPTGAAPDLEELLGTLPESQREVIVMLKVSEMSLEEVARATSSSIGSVKQKAHRAYETLRARFRGGRGAAREGAEP